MTALWTTAKSVVSAVLDHIEEKPSKKQYQLHPDSAYLGSQYYSNSNQLPPNYVIPGASSKPKTSKSLPSIDKDSSDPSGQARSPKAMRPHVHIGNKAVWTPVKLPAHKYTMLRRKDLSDDEKLEKTVGKDNQLYWVIKEVVVHMNKKHSKPDRHPSVKAQETPKETSSSAKVAAQGQTSHNPLNSPSVEDFFADFLEEEKHNRIDTLPINSFAFGRAESATSTSADDRYRGNPLDRIPWSELVVIFRRDTKEIFVRKQDGRMYPVIWEARAIDARDCNKERRSGSRVEESVGIKFTDVEKGEVDADGFVDIEFV